MVEKEREIESIDPNDCSFVKNFSSFDPMFV